LSGYTEPELLAPRTIHNIKQRLRRARAVLYTESGNLLISTVDGVMKGDNKAVNAFLKGLRT
jgi:hypothetical protein